MKRLLKRITAAIAILSAIAGICLGYAYFIKPSRRLVINRQELRIKGWDPAFDGLKIVSIGDIHGGSNRVTEEKIRELVARTNEQNPDVVVLLGDYVSQNHERKLAGQRGLRMPMETVAADLGGLRATYGVFAVLGNHDGWWGDERVASELTRVGYRVLQNEVAVIEKDGHHLRILGFKDLLQLHNRWQETSAMAKRLADAAGDGNIIALEHHPDIMPMITGDLSISPDLKLVLAAHTHGGQVWFPLIGTPIVPSTFGQKYSYGHIIDNNVDLFVTSGVGTSILPIRFMMPPEIAVLTIRSE